MKRYLLKIWYIGTDFHGSQRQPNLRTVEGELIKALKSTSYIDNAKSNYFKAAGRTDAGVHAREAGFCFSSEKIFYPNKLDYNLPKDMGILSFAEVPLEFYPRWEIKLKEYRYIYPILPDCSLNFEEMQKVTKNMEGTHDFTLFSKTDSTKPKKLKELTIEHASLSINDNSKCIVFKFQATSFLWEQIRRIISFIIKIGKNNKTLQDLSNRLNPKFIKDNHSKRDKPANAEGLILWKINFSEEIKFISDEKCKKRMEDNIIKMYTKSQQITSSISTLLYGI